jgi:hypothetical protein
VGLTTPERCGRCSATERQRNVRDATNAQQPAHTASTTTTLMMVLIGAAIRSSLLMRYRTTRKTTSRTNEFDQVTSPVAVCVDGALRPRFYRLPGSSRCKCRFPLSISTREHLPDVCPLENTGIRGLSRARSRGSPSRAFRSQGYRSLDMKPFAASAGCEDRGRTWVVGFLAGALSFSPWLFWFSSPQPWLKPGESRSTSLKGNQKSSGISSSTAA